MKKIVFYVVLIAVFSQITACSFSKLLKSPDWKVRYEGAMQYYEKKDFYRAGLLLEDLVSIVKGVKEAEDIQFKYGYCHFYQRQYSLASHYFKSFFDVYGRSTKAEEALFMSAYSLYMSAPGYELDQESSITAIEAMQDFLNRYPQSEYTPKANDVMNELRERLDKKAFEAAALYFKLERYTGAVIALDNFMKDFPDSRRKEEAYFLRIKSQYLYAKNSIYKAQKERYQKTIAYYLEFIDKYPKTKYLKEAESMYSASQKGIEFAQKQLSATAN